MNKWTYWCDKCCQYEPSDKKLRKGFAHYDARKALLTFSKRELIQMLVNCYKELK